MSSELIAILGGGVALGAMLTPIPVNAKLQSLGERVVKIEGQIEVALQLRPAGRPESG